jgi:predicted N-formylglutamate amidohydrolase
MECEDTRSKFCLYIYSGDNDRPHLLIEVRKDVMWNDYGSSQNAE